MAFLHGIVLMDYRTWNTLTKDTSQSQSSSSSWKRSSSDIHQSALETRGTASPCYAFRGELVREVHGSPLNLPQPIQIERLRHQLGLVQRNEAFLLHAGDCAESFEACTGVSFVSPRTFPSPLPHSRRFFPFFARKANSNRRKTSPRKSDSSSPFLLSLSGAPVCLSCA